MNSDVQENYNKLYRDKKRQPFKDNAYFNNKIYKFKEYEDYKISLEENRLLEEDNKL
jgi:hypothetical protein